MIRETTFVAAGYVIAEVSLHPLDHLDKRLGRSLAELSTEPLVPATATARTS